MGSEMCIRDRVARALSAYDSTLSYSYEFRTLVVTVGLTVSLACVDFDADAASVLALAVADVTGYSSSQIGAMSCADQYRRRELLADSAVISFDISVSEDDIEDDSARTGDALASSVLSTLETAVADGSMATAIASAQTCLLYTSPSPRDGLLSRMPSSA